MKGKKVKKQNNNRGRKGTEKEKHFHQHRERKCEWFSNLRFFFSLGSLFLRLKELKVVLLMGWRDGSLMARRDFRNEIPIVNGERKRGSFSRYNYLIVQIYHLWMRSWVGRIVLKIRVALSCQGFFSKPRFWFCQRICSFERDVLCIQVKFERNTPSVLALEYCSC